MFVCFWLLGVRVEKSSGNVDIHAPLVISDAGVLNTFHKLLPPEVASKSSKASCLELNVFPKCYGEYNYMYNSLSLW